VPFSFTLPVSNIERISTQYFIYLCSAEFQELSIIQGQQALLKQRQGEIVMSVLSPARFQRVAFVALTILIPIAFTACGTPGNTMGMASGMAKQTKAVPLSAPGTPPVLLFNGTGTSASDVVAIETILAADKLAYSTANSSQLNGMSQAQLQAYQLLIVPGGNSITIGNNLNPSTSDKIHDAVTNGGLNYLGVCAGGFFGGASIYNGLNLTSGVWFDFYKDESKGIHKAAVQISNPNSGSLDQYWQDGPQFSGWGSIVGEYPNGAPAIVEGRAGQGWVILVGIHPEAPASWRYGMNFTTSVAADNAYAITLVNAALKGTSLPHY
jgi:glutamine amidotransferase-like uncharacterized protein